MIIDNVKLETAATYAEEMQKYYVLKIIVDIPGGYAHYEIPSTRDINESLENAVKLQIKGK